MRTGKKIVAMLVSLGIMIQAVPLESGAMYDWYSGENWRFNIAHDDNGILCIYDLGYAGPELDINIPEEIENYKVKSINLDNFEINDTEWIFADVLTLHVPDDIIVNEGNDDSYSYYPIRHFIIDYETKEDYTVDYDDRVSFYDSDAITAAKEWDYRILDKLDGVYDGPCVELLKYNGVQSNIICPLEIEGYPVALVSKDIFKDNNINYDYYPRYIAFSVPLSVDEDIYEYDDYLYFKENLKTEEYTYKDYLDDHKKDYGFKWPQIKLADGCLDNCDQVSLYFCDYNYSAQCVKDDNGDNNFINGRWKTHSHDISYLLTRQENGEYNLALASVYSFKDKKLDIPDYIAGHPVTAIQRVYTSGSYIDDLYQDDDIADDYLKGEIRLPDTVKLIQPNAFMGLYVTSINIPENVKILPNGCLGNYNYVKEIKGIDKVPFISDELFSKSGKYKVPDYDLSEWEHLINKDNLVHFNYKVEDLTEEFMMTDIYTGNTYKVKIDPVDYSLSLKLIYFPDKTKEIPKEFHGIPVTKAISSVMPKGAKIVIPEDQKVFTNDKMVYYITELNDSHHTLSDLDYYYEEQSAFTDEIEIQSKDIRLEEDAFLYAVPKSLEFPGSAYLCKNFMSNSMAIEKLAFTGEKSKIVFEDRAISNHASLKELTFPDKCTDLEIGPSAFLSCGIESLELPEGTSLVDTMAFSKNVPMKELTVNGSPEIKEMAFAGCKNLTTVTINGTPEFEDEVFDQCENITDLNIDISKKINGRAFNKCKKLTRINGEEVFNKDGSPKEKYREFIEKNFAESDDNGIINKYVDYRLKQLVAETITDDMNEMQKVKAIHDKICSMVEYDTGNIEDNKNHTDVSIFLHKKTVCEGYARAFNLLLHEVGIKSCFVYNDTHSWVMAELGGHCFHIDVTWDDGDVINYDWFLKTDDEIKGKESHEKWKIGTPSSMHNFQWYNMPKSTEKMGDVTKDGVVDGRDASAILSAYTKASVGEDLEVDIILADYDYNGIIDAVDASAVLTAYAKSSVN